jgi:predicted nucleotidyltransferase
MRTGLKNTTIQAINGVFAHYPQVEQVVLYGSRAKGDYKKGSDIDLTLKGDGLELSTLLQICNEIDDLLLPYSFDISIFSHISNPELREHIKRVGIVFFESKPNET